MTAWPERLIGLAAGLALDAALVANGTAVGLGLGGAQAARLALVTALQAGRAAGDLSRYG